jgi:hypothetical protein
MRSTVAPDVARTEPKEGMTRSPAHKPNRSRTFIIVAVLLLAAGGLVGAGLGLALGGSASTVSTVQMAVVATGDLSDYTASVITATANWR